MTAYYNEIDPAAAQWLRNLIVAGRIAPGIVDERSIEDVKQAQDRLAGSSCGQEAGGKLGKAPTPFQATCSLKCFVLFRFFRVLGGVRSPKRDPRRMTRSTVGQVGLCEKTSSGLNQEAAFPLSETCTSSLCLDLRNGTLAPCDCSLFFCIRRNKVFAGLHLALRKIAFCTPGTPLASRCLFPRLPTYTRPRTLASSTGFWSAWSRTSMSNERTSFHAYTKPHSLK